MKPAKYRYSTIPDVDHLAEVIASMLNSHGGVVELPFNDRYQELIDEAVNKIDPVPAVFVKKEEDSIAIFVSPSKDKPHLINGTVYILKNGHPTKASFVDLKNMFKREPYKDDMLLDEPLEILDHQLISKLVSEKLGEKWPEDFLRELGLVIYNKPTLASSILFGRGRRPEHFVYEIRGSNTLSSSKIESTHSISGNVFIIYQELLKFLDATLSSLFEGREKETLLNIIKEAVVNSLIHRDIFSPAPSFISLEENEISIWNPGESLLPIEDYDLPHPSLRRNPRIYEAFCLLGESCEGGLGTIKILSLSKDIGVEPVYEIKWSGTLLRLSLERKVSEELNERQIAFLKYLEDKGRATRKDYEKLTGVKERTARLDIEELIERGLIVREGRGRNIYYVLKKKS